MEPDKTDLAVLDPSRNAARWDRMTARVLEMHRLRQVVVRRSAVAALLAAAAVLAFLWSKPQEVTRTSDDILSWGIRDPDSSELLRMGGHDAY